MLASKVPGGANRLLQYEGVPPYVRVLVERRTLDNRLRRSP
jgi:hypothetical protein